MRWAVLSQLSHASQGNSGTFASELASHVPHRASAVDCPVDILIGRGPLTSPLVWSGEKEGCFGSGCSPVIPPSFPSLLTVRRWERSSTGKNHCLSLQTTLRLSFRSMIVRITESYKVWMMFLNAHHTIHVTSLQSRDDVSSCGTELGRVDGRPSSSLTLEGSPSSSHLRAGGKFLPHTGLSQSLCGFLKWDMTSFFHLFYSWYLTDDIYALYLLPVT